jgi:hypothetical protein
MGTGLFADVSWKNSPLLGRRIGYGPLLKRQAYGEYMSIKV